MKTCERSDEAWVEELRNVKALWCYREGGPHAVHTMADVHSDLYLNTDIVASSPALITAMARELAQRARASVDAQAASWVISYTGAVSASLVIASAISGLLNFRSG